MTMKEITRILEGEILDESTEFDLEGLCRACQVDRKLAMDLVVEGIVEPSHRDLEQWRFTGTAVCRAQVAVRLRRELGVNVAGAALALELLDEISRLRRALDRRR